MRTTWITTLMIMGCGTIEPRPIDDLRQDVPTTDTHVETTISDPTTSEEFQFPSTWKRPENAWRIDISGTGAPGLPEGVLDDLPRDLVIEVLVNDPPVLSTRIGAVFDGSDPAVQDLCVASFEPLTAKSESDGRFALLLDGVSADLGQPFAWDAVALTGWFDEATGTVVDGEWHATIEVAELADMFPGTEDPCEELTALDLTCVPCADSSGDCMEVVLPVNGGIAAGFVLEPIQPDDVISNPDCAFKQ